MVDVAAAQRPLGRREASRVDLLPDLSLRLRARVAAWFEAERPRLGLWAPVALGAGAVLYFLARSEPPDWFSPLVLTAACGVALVTPNWKPAAAAAALVAAGYFVADMRAALVDAPAIGRDIRFAEVTGRIIAIDEAPKLRRLIIEVDEIEGLDEASTPARIRLSWRGAVFDTRAGDLVSVRASLSPPPRPAAPQGFDFARQLYFQRIGAVGFAVSPPTVIEEKRRPLPASARAFVERVRVDLSRRILEKADGDSGAIVAAVVTGKREAISEEAEAAFRDSGLAHLLSISGLHMGLATGIIFFTSRALLALIEPIALRFPIKKWAAGGALVSGFLYLLISGGAWPAERAFIMSAIFFIAIIADRRALSLRNVAIAAFVIILLSPEAVLHPGFQMSFAAVTALIASYEWASARADPSRSFSPLARLRRYIFGIGVTDTIAATATAPYALYHFNRTANFGLAANLVSIPVMGFWVMPAAIAAMLLTPFGADGPFWMLAAKGVDLMLFLARWTTSLPGAVTVFPQWPASALGVLTMGGLWLCLWSKPWRLAGIASVPIAAALIAAAPHPRIFISDEGDNAGVVFAERGAARIMAVADRRRGKFDARVWSEQAGIDIEMARPALLAENAPCDLEGCVLRDGAAAIAISTGRAGLDDDCARASLVIALYPVSAFDRRNCAVRIIDRRDAWEHGAHALYVSDAVIRIATVDSSRGLRPWTKEIASAPGTEARSRFPLSRPAR